MLKLLRSFLVFSFLGVVVSAISNLYQEPVLLVFSLLLNTLVYFGFWKGTILVSNNPEGQNTKKSIQLLRWFLLFIYSILVVEMAVIIIFIFRFMMNTLYVQGNRDQLFVAIMNETGDIFLKIYIILSLLLSIYPLLLVSKTLKFVKPYLPVSLVILIWAVLLLFVSPFFGFK